MTKAKAIRAVLRKHYHGKEFTATDIAAKVDSTPSYAQRILKDMPGITAYKKPATGVGMGHLRDVTYYQFDADAVDWKGDKRERIEAAVKSREGEEFSSSELAQQLGIHRTWVLRVIQDIRGVRFVRKDKVPTTKGCNGDQHIFTFKPVSTDKWVA